MGCSLASSIQTLFKLGREECVQFGELVEFNLASVVLVEVLEQQPLEVPQRLAVLGYPSQLSMCAFTGETCP